MSLLLEQYIPVVNENGLNTNKAVAFGSTLTVAGAATFSAAVSTGALTASSLIVTSALSIGSLTGSTQALSGSGAVNLTTLTTKITTTGANALTLADGSDGQIKCLTCVSGGAGTATLTPTTKTGFSTIAFDNTGDGCILVFTTTTGWTILGTAGATINP